MSHSLHEIKIQNKHIVLILASIIFSTILVRAFFYPYDLPITHDGNNYFSYALDTSILNSLPTDYTLPNNGWPVFLSLFFKIFQFDSALGYMDLQRVLSIIISVTTIIPVYFLCRKFFSPILSLIGCILFAFSPQLIQNSLLGIAEPLYIFLITVSLSLFLSKKPKLVYCSFWIITLASIVRYEGIVLLIPLSIIFFIKFENKKKIIPKYFFIIIICILILLPIAYLRMETTNNDGFSNVIKGPQYIINVSTTEEYYHKSIIDFIKDGITGIFKYLGWSLIPYFLILVPFGIMKIFRNMNYNKKTIILFSAFLLIPAFYAYSREFEDGRYVFVMYPIFALISLYLIEFFMNKKNNVKWISGIVIGIIGCSSIFFLIDQVTDYDYEREYLDIAFYIYHNMGAVNNYYPEGKYLNFLKYDASNDFPKLSKDFPLMRNYKIISEAEVPATNSIIEYIEFTKEKNLTHIVTNGVNAKPDILNSIFSNENDYPYLEKIFDSKEQGYQVHVKIFKVNYDMIETNVENELSK
ncbi:glycosyltransferase family 39 protein [Candidatus Nitrosopelagicus sp.]|nr:glycosyltransferase family 39 protein [Candidatus Nitrosopelagicus sp.]